MGDAVLASEGASHRVTQTIAANANGSTTTTISGFDNDGVLAFRNLVTKSADGSHRATQYDDDGNGIYDRSQSDDLTINANGSRTRVVDAFDAAGALVNETITTTSADARGPRRLNFRRLSQCKRDRDRARSVCRCRNLHHAGRRAKGIFRERAIAC